MPAHLVAEEGPHQGLVLNLTQGDEWTLGRGIDQVDFLIEDDTVSRKHAKLTKTGEEFYLENLSRTNPTLVNDAPPEGKVLLKEGDRIQIGHTVFLFSQGAIPETREPPKKSAGGYDDVFEDLEEVTEPEIPPPPEEKPQESPAEKNTESTGYDTIFEEGGDEEELPFNLLPETPLLLKVISGPNAGAEIGIEKGHSYVIGKDPQAADIVFQDLSVSRSHARISVSADGIIELEDLGSKNGTVVNGTPITEKKAVTSQDLIAMGTTVFLIIDREAPQETIYSAALPAFEPAKAPPVEGKEEPLAIAEEKTEPAVDWKKQPIPLRHLVIGASLVAICLIALLSFFSLFKPKGPALVRKEPESQIKEALEKFPDVQFSFNPASGKLFLVGHVLTNVEYQEMRYRIGEIPFIGNTEDTVVIDEGVSKMMNDILQSDASWRGVSVFASTAGHFTVSGYVQTTEQLTLLGEYLTVNFPYLDRLNNQVVSLDMLNTQVDAMLLSKGFGAIAVQLNNGQVILSGVYNNQMESEYNELLHAINEVKGVTSVQNLAIPTSPNAAAIDLTTQYRVSGSSMFDGLGYSVVLNGKIYTVGDAVDGMMITTIAPNTILLAKDGVKYKIDYTR